MTAHFPTLSTLTQTIAGTRLSWVTLFCSTPLSAPQGTQASTGQILPSWYWLTKSITGSCCSDCRALVSSQHAVKEHVWIHPAYTTCLHPFFIPLSHEFSKLMGFQTYAWFGGNKAGEKKRTSVDKTQGSLKSQQPPQSHLSPTGGAAPIFAKVERLFFFFFGSVTRVTRTILWSQQSFLKCERGQRPALSIPPHCLDHEFAIQIPATPEQAMSLAAVKSISESSWGCVPRSCCETRWTELEKTPVCM